MKATQLQRRLRPYRRRIEELDAKIVALVSERAKQSVEIGKIKGELTEHVLDPVQEKEVYKRIAGLNEGPLPDGALKAIYREIMSGSLALQKTIRVAYLGPEATFTHQAALTKFGRSVEYVPTISIGDVFYEVETRRADYGVVPIENSTDGAVNHTLDMFIDSDLRICSEIVFEISHCLLAKCSRNQIKRVHSKGEVFGQCKLWLRANLPRAEQIEASSTSRAAETASQQPGSAAIASEVAASLYGLRVVAHSIQDTTQNVTRFLVIGRSESPKSGDDKTSVMFYTKDKVGALHDVLEVFKEERINLAMIESRPSRKKPFEYYFFADFAGYITDPKVASTIKKLKKKCGILKVLGSYPRSS
ncbi:prephenate dehydratase [bacterium]|nr:prephenate dehydratase [bacterium]